MESLPTARILLLVNYRPEYRHDWGSKSVLHPASGRSAAAGERRRAARRRLSGDDASLEPLQALLIARTEGNPFFLEESVRSLVETGALVGERGAYRLAGPLEDIRVPATVQAVLAARIDRLPPEEKRLLQTAAVIGKDVPYALLASHRRACRRTSCGAGLARLQAAEFLYEASLFPELEYTFKHALTHEVAYGSLLQERRETLHGRVVEAIERLYADRLDEHVERLAHHALRGEDWERGRRLLRSQAGEKALSRSAYREAVATSSRRSRRSAIFPGPPDARAGDRHPLRLCARACSRWRSTSASPSMLQRSRGARRVARRPARDSASLASMANLLRRRSTMTQADRAGERALDHRHRAWTTSRSRSCDTQPSRHRRSTRSATCVEPCARSLSRTFDSLARPSDDERVGDRPPISLLSRGACWRRRLGELGEFDEATWARASKRFASS